MNKKIFIISGLLILTAIFAGGVYAQFENITYPIGELGGCVDQAACKEYCDDSTNADACLAFAKANQLMSDKEIAVARQFLSGELNGPGGCKDKDSCEIYCEDISHIDECIIFAEENSFLPADQLEEAKKVQAAIARGIKPPACGNKKACDAYCEDSGHMEECITFGIEAGFIQGKELEDAQKMLEAVKRGVNPPPCKGKEACDEYCSNPDNMEVCINFAIEAGMMSEQEAADSQKMLQALKKGVKPPACKGKEECDAYCGSEEHFEECINFSVAAGFMSEEDAAMARKTGGKGPGDCRGKEECEAFCNNPANQETCFNFGKENGLISQEDLQRMEEGKQETMNALNQASPETIQCLNEALGAEFVEKMRSGTAMLSQEIGDKMSTCFMQNNGGMQTGPGGCQSPEECQQYCAEHPDECQKFQPGPGEINPGDQMMPPQSGPGGCKTPEECQAYCQANPQDCGVPSGPGPAGNQMMPTQPCQGENCQYGPMPGQEFQPMQNMQPLGEPGSGGGMIPGTQEVPLAPPANLTPPVEQQPPAENPPPSASSIGTNSLLGSLLYTIFQLLLPH